MLEEVPGSRLSLGDRVRVKGVVTIHAGDIEDAICKIVFFPIGTDDIVIQSEKTMQCHLLDRRHLVPLKTEVVAVLRGWVVGFKDGHAEFWNHNPSGLTEAQANNIGMIGFKSVAHEIRGFAE